LGCIHGFDGIVNLLSSLIVKKKKMKVPLIVVFYEYGHGGFGFFLMVEFNLAEFRFWIKFVC